ncbi:MAG: hypothetical protein KKD44_22840 [Proteobacteria bacterium]|nr:hypothetical protein [Pseudomonadota bacterium]
MRKLRYLTTIVCALCLFALPSSGFAKMTHMSDEELDQITAQAGFSDMLGIVQINRDNETGTYFFGGSGSGYISFADTKYEGTMGIDPSMTTRIVDNNGAMGYECTLDGPIMDIKNFSTTIRLGTDIGAGNSMGTVYIGHMVVDVHGTLRITAH